MQKNAFSKKFMAGGAMLLSLSAVQVAQAQFTLNLTADAGNVTTTGGDGTTVTAWNDTGSANADLTGSGGVNAPIWHSGAVNGSSTSGYLSFTGSELDVLAASGISAGSLFSANQVAISMVIRPGAGNTANTLFNWAGGGTYVQVAENDVPSATPGFVFVHNNQLYQVSEPSGWEGNWSILTVVRNGDAGELRLNGTAFASSATAFAGAGDLNLSLSGTVQVGQTVGYPQYWTGDIAAIRISTDPSSVGATEAALGSAYNLAPVPEPSQYATVFSLICVAGALVYRQRRQRALAS